GLLGSGQRASRVGEGARRRVGGLGGFQARVGRGRRDVGAAERALGFALRRGLARAGLFGGGLRALARGEGGVEREGVGALRDGVVGALQRVFGGLELVGRVLGGAGGARGLDGGLRLLNFLVGRIAARGEHHGGQDCQRRDRATAHHEGS